jgi:hypothetical protein
MASDAALSLEVAHDVTVGVEQTHVWYDGVAEMSLPSRFAQQVLDQEHRRFVVVICRQVRREDRGVLSVLFG